LRKVALCSCGFLPGLYQLALFGHDIRMPQSNLSENLNFKLTHYLKKSLVKIFTIRQFLTRFRRNNFVVAREVSVPAKLLKTRWPC
jgi:hypothetical protein